MANGRGTCWHTKHGSSHSAEAAWYYQRPLANQVGHYLGSTRRIISSIQAVHYRPHLCGRSAWAWCYKIRPEKHIFSKYLFTYVNLFANSCLHCLATTKRGRVPRPICLAIHGSAPNNLLQLDSWNLVADLLYNNRFYSFVTITRVIPGFFRLLSTTPKKLRMLFLPDVLPFSCHLNLVQKAQRNFPTK